MYSRNFIGTINKRVIPMLTNRQQSYYRKSISVTMVLTLHLFWKLKVELVDISSSREGSTYFICSLTG